MPNRIYVFSQLAYPELISTGQTITELSEELVRQNQKVTIFCAQPSLINQKKVNKKINHQGIEIQRLRSTQFKKSNILGKLINHLTFSLSVWLKFWALPKKSTILLLTNPPILPLLTLAVFKKHKTHILLFDLYPETLIAANIIKKENGLAKAYHYLNNRVYKKAESVIAIGRCMQQKVQEKVPTLTIAYIPIWCDDQHIKTNKKQIDFKQKWGLDNKFLVGYSGNLARFHPIETMINAAIKLQNDPDIVFVFVGEGAKKEPAQEMAKKTKNCHFFTYVDRDELPDLLSSFDCGLVGLNTNQTGLSVPSKAMGLLSAGVPILACCEEETETVQLIKEHQCGEWVLPNQSDPLAEKIKSLKNSKEKQKKYQNNALNASETHFSLSQITKQFIEQLR